MLSGSILLLTLATPLFSLPITDDGKPIPDVTTNSDLLAPFFPTKATQNTKINAVSSTTALSFDDLFTVAFTTILSLAYLSPSEIPPPQTFRANTVSLTLNSTTARINSIWLLFKSLDDIASASTFVASNFTLTSGDDTLSSISYSTASPAPLPTADSTSPIAGTVQTAGKKRDLSANSPLLNDKPEWTVNWTGVASPNLNARFYLSLSALAAQIATAPDKDQVADSLEAPAYPSLRLQNVKIAGQSNLLTYRNALDVLMRAFREGKAKDGKGVLNLREDWKDGDMTKASWTLNYKNT